MKLVLFLNSSVYDKIYKIQANRGVGNFYLKGRKTTYLVKYYILLS